MKPEGVDPIRALISGGLLWVAVFVMTSSLIITGMGKPVPILPMLGVIALFSALWGGATMAMARRAKRPL